MKKKQKERAILFIISILFISVLNTTAVEVKASDNINYPAQITLATFFNSEKDMTDTLYVSFDGYTFYKIGGDNTGIYVSRAINIDQPWTIQEKVTLKDYNGNEADGRHGSVMVLSNEQEAYQKVIQKYIEIYGKSVVDEPQKVTMNGLFRSNGEFYLYQEGKMVTSKEIYDQKTDAGYWFDADGTMARNKSVYIPYNADRTEGKWVYYDNEGHMVKGESYHDGYWYYYDMTTGIRE